MPGRGKKRGARLPRQLALGMLEDAMARVEQQQQQEEEEQEEIGKPAAVPYPRSGRPAPAVPAARTDLPADVPVDNSAGPEPSAEDDSAPQQRELPAQRSGKKKSTRHGSFG
jgi:hypothetical protein